MGDCLTITSARRHAGSTRPRVRPRRFIGASLPQAAAETAAVAEAAQERKGNPNPGAVVGLLYTVSLTTSSSVHVGTTVV